MDSQGNENVKENLRLYRVLDGKMVQALVGDGPMSFNSKGDITVAESFNNIIRIYRNRADLEWMDSTTTT